MVVRTSSTVFSLECNSSFSPVVYYHKLLNSQFSSLICWLIAFNSPSLSLFKAFPAAVLLQFIFRSRIPRFDTTWFVIDQPMANLIHKQRFCFHFISSFFLHYVPYVRLAGVIYELLSATVHESEIQCNKNNINSHQKHRDFTLETQPNWENQQNRRRSALVFFS